MTNATSRYISPGLFILAEQNQGSDSIKNQALQQSIEADAVLIASHIHRKYLRGCYELATALIINLGHLLSCTLAKYYLSIAGKCVGNFVYTTGLDDIASEVVSAINGEFSRIDSWTAKQASTISAGKSPNLVYAINSALTLAHKNLGNV